MRDDEIYVCPSCYKIDGQHTDDCPLAMLGAGIDDPDLREKEMLKQLFDGE